MVYEDKSKDAITVFSGKACRALLRLGFTIIDVKADKFNKFKSVFIFKRENNIEQALNEIMYKEENVK